jgi:hypothetical protein
MALIQQDNTAREEKALREHQDEIAELREAAAQRKADIAVSFKDGAITVMGLEIEMRRLDVERRGMNPIDQSVQSLVQGQQNQVARLMELEKSWLMELENMLSRLNEAEAELQVLVERKQQRSENT